MKKSYRPLAILEHEVDAMAEAEALAMAAQSDHTGDRPDSELLDMYEGVGVVTIEGTLTNRNSFFNSWYGLISYDEIRASVVEALELGATSILFNYDSPGGSVHGMAALGSFIKSLDVPTVSYSSAQMASAAYYLGVSANEVFADSMAELGSVGVILKLYDVTERMKQQGVKSIILRSGSKKGIGGGDEKLSPENRKYLQGQVATYAEKFFSYVSENTGIPRPSMGPIEEGGTFIGEEAVLNGLASSVKTFDEALLHAMSLAEAKRISDETAATNHSRSIYNSSAQAQGDTDMAKTISKEHLAALVNAGSETPAPGASAEGGDPTDTEVELTEEETAAAAAEASAEPQETEVEDEVELEAVQADLVAMTEQYDAAQVELAEAHAELDKFKASAAEFDKAAESVVPMKEAICTQIASMRVALSLTSVDMVEWDASAIMKEYEAISETFKKSLVPGGVAPQEHEETEAPVTTRSEANAIKNLGF